MLKAWNLIENTRITGNMYSDVVESALAVESDAH
jgi:hypothetical protein